MLIHELAARAGVAPHTIRFYEREGLLDAQVVERLENNYRHYHESALQRIAMIKHGQSAGFSLSEIRGLLHAWDTGALTVEEQLGHLQKKIAEVTTKINELEQLRQYLITKVGRLEELSAPADRR
jgi:MerR family transcriptional regulator, copper efflux regulator